MFKSKIIETLFNETQENNSLQLTDEIQTANRKISYAECKLEKFINNSVSVKSREKLDILIDNYSRAIADYYFEVMKVNYEQGFFDCAGIIKTMFL